jgi:GT2 family glycosyltransferase
MKIAVVIVTYNRKSELIKTIKAVESQGITQHDIIVINNNSSDGTRQILDLEFSKLNAVHLEENIASAGGFSKGMQFAHEKGYNWVWLFNDDSRPVAGTLASVKAFLEDASKYKIGLLKIGNINNNGQAILLFWNGVRRPVYTAVSDDLVPTDLITFDGCFISAELMSKIGYCDPEFFMGTYEFDYCLKAKDAGFGIYTVPNGLIDDGKLGGKGGTPPWRQYYNTRNHLWLGLNRKSFKICFAWFRREIKYTYAILFYYDKKYERLLFKLRAIRDAFMNRRGKRYDPENIN